MKKCNFTLTKIFVIILGSSFISCNKENHYTPDDHYAKTGLYMGVIGFNSDLNTKTISPLSESTKYEFADFIDDMEPHIGTVLYHAVNNAIDNLENTVLPNDMVNVSIVTFTDGLDIGSYMLNSKYSSGAEYLNAVNNRIKTTKIRGLNISAYSIGVRGDDVSDIDQFQSNLSKLASSSENAIEVTNMVEVNDKFRQIATSLYNESSSQNMILNLPAPEPGSKIRLTFDYIDDKTDDASVSEMYLEGTYSSDLSLSNIVYHGLTCNSGSKIIGSVSGIFITFEFKKLALASGGGVPTNNLKQWAYKESTSKWQVNSEFDPNANTETTIEQKSAVIILVLDCSSSLGSDFQKMQESATTFINTLLDNSITSRGISHIRFEKHNDYIYATKLGVIDESLSYLIVGVDFGSNAGYSDYYEMPAGYAVPSYYYTYNNYNNWVTCFENNLMYYYFLDGYKYSLHCLDDGTYLNFEISEDGRY